MAWSEVSELPRTKAGIAVALYLPESDETLVREKVFSQLSIAELKQENGLDILISFLDKHLAKGDLSDCLQKFEDFDGFSRNETHSVKMNISLCLTINTEK